MVANDVRSYTDEKILTRIGNVRRAGGDKMMIMVMGWSFLGKKKRRVRPQEFQRDKVNETE